MYCIMAMRDGHSRDVEADSDIAAAIHVTAFIADGFVVKVIDAQTGKPFVLGPNGLSAFQHSALGRTPTPR